MKPLEYCFHCQFIETDNEPLVRAALPGTGKIDRTAEKFHVLCWLKDRLEYVQDSHLNFTSEHAPA